MSGATILNRFELGERLGAGGNGTVYRAWDRRLDREVAVKVIETAGSSGPRIQREAQAAARLNHPAIVSLYEFVHHELGPDGGRAYLVSELVEGATLRALIDRNTLSDREIGLIGLDACAALDHAHSRKVVHRDIKPGNLMVPAGGTGVKLMDFGIARLLEEDDLTRTGDVLGTLAYMPPEQARGLPVGPGGDLFALALTLHEAWTGENPRRAATPAGLLETLARPVPRLSHLRPDLPPVLTDTIERCLEVDPRHRPPVRDLGHVLERTLAGLDPHPPVEPEPAPYRRSGFSLKGVGRVVSGVGIGATGAASVALSGHAGPLSVSLAFLLPGILSLASPRLGMLVAGIGSVFWLAGVAALPGAALVVGLVAVPPALLLRGDGRALAVIPVAPLLGLAGVAPLVPLLSAVATRWRDRAVIAAAGLVATALVQVAAGRPMLPGRLPAAGPDWSRSVHEAVAGLLLPALTTPAFLVSLPAWVIVAVLAGMVRDRVRRSRKRRRSGEFGVPDVGSGRYPTGVEPFRHEPVS